MKSFPWIVAVSRPSARYATGIDDVEGRRDRLAGKFKEGLGHITGSDDLENEGVLEQATGVARDATESVARAVGDTIASSLHVMQFLAVHDLHY